MIASVEKQKFVYIMNRDSANRLTISSPLEAHKSESILFSICGVDVGFDNPIFAMIELDYGEVDQDPTGEAAIEAEKKLTYYELDLGLNHVVRKWSEPISRTANFLLTVPGGDDGPSGVLICGENWISYKNQGHVEVRAAVPRRHNLPVSRGVLIVTGTVHKQKDLYFFMVQSELGDLYKVSLVLSPTDRKVVADVVISVFDAIQPANGLCITKTGLLFAASEFGNHSLFQFQGIGDGETSVRSSKILDDDMNEELGDDSLSAARVAPIFVASAKLQNLLLIDELSSLAPITDLLVDDFADEVTPQIVALCGRGHRSSLRLLRHGVSVSEMAVSELPGKPYAVWTVKASQSSLFDRYIVVSLAHTTLVLSIGETVEEVTDSGFLSTTATLQVVLLDDSALLQVYSAGIRHIRADKRISEWKAPGKRIIEKAAVNSRQVAISLAGGEIVYFELDATGTLMEMGSLDLGREVSSLDLGEVPPGRSKTMFLAVGCWDDTVALLSLDASDLLGQRASLATPARPDSLCLVETTLHSSEPGQPASSSPKLLLAIGLSSGVLIRAAVDPLTGAISESRQRFLGPRSLRLVRVRVNQQPGVMCLSTRPWLLYAAHGRYLQAPMSYETLEHCASFTSEQCSEGVVAVTASSLRIFTVDNLGEYFNQTSVPLRYTPRKMVRIAGTKQLLVIETDHNELDEAQREAWQQPPQEQEEDEERTTLPLRGPMPASDGRWASCIRIIEPATGVSSELLELTNNEAAFSVCTCRFLHHSEEMFVVVGTAKDLMLHGRQVAATRGYLHVYRLLDGRLRLLHQTEIEDVPLAITEFHGKLLVGAGRCLRLYDMGRKKLLRKCENRQFPSAICRLQTTGDRVYVGTVSDGVHIVKYRRAENSLTVFADETFPRFITAITVLDYDSVAGVDKFGNVFVLRLPDGYSDEVGGPAGVRLLWDQGSLNGAPTKLDMLTHYYLGETPTAVVKCALVPGGPEVLVLGSVTGGLHCLLPLASREDIIFYQHLEMFMRQESATLCQRDHLSYRSYFTPVKATIDGTLCEGYSKLLYDKQKEFAGDVDRTPAEVIRKLEDVRNIM